ncbi:MAG: hypothetical protein WDO69_28475 [Pseudomonadota bacterium]
MFGRRACAGLGGIALILSVLGCALDDRSLSRSSELTGGFGNGSSGTGGDALGVGGSAPLEPLPSDCDYSKDARPECQSLVENPGFAVDTAGWDPEMGPLTLTWKNNDATDDPASGSLSLLNAFFGEADGPIALGAFECLPATAGQAYAIAGDVFVPEGQGDGPDGGSYMAGAGFSVVFKDDTACQGHTLSSFSSDVVTEPEVWTHREATGVAPRGAGSMNVRLITLKNFREYMFEAWFDNVLVRPR